MRGGTGRMMAAVQQIMFGQRQRTVVRKTIAGMKLREALIH
jgi:hypothetical protein